MLPRWATGDQPRGNLSAPFGIVDRPFDQRRDLLVADLNGSTGNLAIVGGPQSGKSTALRTLILSLSMTHTPEQIQFYCLDFGGGTLLGLKDLPHVGSVANRLDSDRVRRTVAEVLGVVAKRERLFRDLGIESMADFRRLRTVDPPGGKVRLRDSERTRTVTSSSSSTVGQAFVRISNHSSPRSTRSPVKVCPSVYT